ncbi:protein phosphatase 1 regulatory subunit 3C-B [Hydra vulgaris]|uniref:Protein phosphatase 1 regulatory subunit 3C-B n=1 Tax=Hydra vulgaris TaxID=6087 RepID=A0ABM4CLR6_HYDVU
MLANRNCCSYSFAPFKNFHKCASRNFNENTNLFCAINEATLKHKSSDRKKKKVCFADEKGGILCHIKFLPKLREECSDNKSYAIKLSDHSTWSFLRGITYQKSVFREELLMKNNLCVLTYGTVENKYIFGLVAVKHCISYKTVHARITLNKWKTFRDIICKLTQHQNALKFDCYFFLTSMNGQKFSEIQELIEFAICSKNKDEQSWDNNEEKNYSFVGEHLVRGESGGLVENN